MPGNEDALAKFKRWSPDSETRVPQPGRDGSSAERLEAEITARLEWLDDVMFAAIDGDAAALDAAADAWKRAQAELGKQATEQSRRQYLQRAQKVWNDLRRQPNHPPHKLFAAIEIISLLSEKSW